MTADGRAIKREAKRRAAAHFGAVLAHQRDMLDMAAEEEQRRWREVAESGVRVRQLVEALDLIGKSQ